MRKTNIKCTTDMKSPLSQDYTCGECKSLFNSRELFLTHMRREHGKVKVWLWFHKTTYISAPLTISRTPVTISCSSVTLLLCWAPLTIWCARANGLHKKIYKVNVFKLFFSCCLVFQIMKKHPCRQCDKSFSSSHSLCRHNRLKHKGLRKVYTCP